MKVKPFLKWAGGKRWLVEHEGFTIPNFSGKYIEPFMGGAAVFFSIEPKKAILSDVNPRLVETYVAIRDDWQEVVNILKAHQKYHCKEYYYEQRAKKFRSIKKRAAQFLYLNRTCWNGLYRENLKGEFNVPIGTKTNILLADDNFLEVSTILKNADIKCCDFADSIRQAQHGDLLFVDPPYTTAHNMNGFVKYNQKIFRWEDQIRLRDELLLARERGAKVILTNAHHESVHSLYSPYTSISSLPRSSVISGRSKGRIKTEEMLVYL